MPRIPHILLIIRSKFRISNQRWADEFVRVRFGHELMSELVSVHLRFEWDSDSLIGRNYEEYSTFLQFIFPKFRVQENWVSPLAYQDRGIKASESQVPENLIKVKTF